MNRIEKLKETKNKLKSEFVGIDDIIDRVIDAVTPWYLTPEVLERPTVISLWGLTGTGKTSLIRKLINYLGLSGKSLFFDCGEQGGDSDTRMFSEKLNNLFESSKIQEGDLRYTSEELSKMGITIGESSAYTGRMDPLDFTFVFDEFQYLKTKNPSTGEEENRPEGRAIWSLMDSGVVDINDYNYRTKSLMDYLEDMEVFCSSYPGLKIKESRFDTSATPLLKQQLSYYRWTDEEEESKKGLRVLFEEDFTYLVKKLNALQKGLGFQVGDKLMSFEVLDDFILYIKDYITLISKPKIINCSKSLVFVLGNLDEAFELTGEDLDPDVDADVYHEITSKVNCMDIKTALRKRFRDEQIGRLGNNIIIYPSLRRCDFEEIIRKEVVRITDKFRKSHNDEITVMLSTRFFRLIYSEGCFPIQGCRPLFSTINSLVSPLLSIIIMSGKKGYISLDVLENNFNTSKVNLIIKAEDGEIIGKKEVNLNLGALRSPERCSKLGLQAVHEASHAVLYKILTGKNPSAIIASNIFGDGGYMMHEISKDTSVESILELRNEVAVSLAGFYGEREFFTEKMCSLGATSDINHVWEILRKGYYEAGMVTPMKFSEKGVSSENEGLPYGLPEDHDKVNNSLYDFFWNCCDMTKTYVKREKKLIAKVSEYLIENRSMGISVFEEYVKEYREVILNPEDKDYYKKKITDYLYGNERSNKSIT